MQPTQMGPYTFGARLGRGGMGAVYEATDTGTGETVAVKVLAAHLADDGGLRKRFTAEIETLKSLRHSGIVQLLAFGEEDGQPYFAMELVRGMSLEQILRSGRRFDWRETVTLTLAISRALKVAHDHGIIHRDLKPANLLIAASGTGPGNDGEAAAADAIGMESLAAVKLADFGIAKLFGAAGHTAHGNIVGTAEYMAPEQAWGKPVDHRVDLYALGLVMFAMLAGRPPFTGRQVIDVIERQRREPPPRISAIVSGVPAELDVLIDRLLAKDPAARPANALALGRLLTAIDTLHAPTGTAAPAPAPTGAGPSATHHEQRQSPTKADAASTSAQLGQPVDLFAATQAHTTAPANDPSAGSPPADGRLIVNNGHSRTSRGAQNDATHPFAGRLPQATTHLTGQFDAVESRAAAADTIVDRAARNRFTTVQELDKAARTQADRDRAARHRWQILTALATLAALGAGGYLLVKPPTADELHARIVGIIAANPDRQDALRDAERLISQYLESYPQAPQAAAVRGLERELDVDRLRIRADRRVKRSRPPHLRIEREYRMAMAVKTTAPGECVAALQRILAMPLKVLATPVADRVEDDELARSPDLWLALVSDQIQKLQPLVDAEKRATRQNAPWKGPSE